MQVSRLLSRYVVAGSDRDSESRTGRLAQVFFQKPALGLIRLEIRCLSGIKFAQLELDRLRFSARGRRADLCVVRTAL